MKAKLAVITEDELRQYRQIHLKAISLEINPHAYSAAETEEIERDKLNFWTDLSRKHNLDPLKTHYVDFAFGDLIETDD